MLTSGRPLIELKIGDRAVIGREIELGSRHGGQRQQRHCQQAGLNQVASHICFHKSMRQFAIGSDIRKAVLLRRPE
jgi:hypothetical protein